MGKIYYTLDGSDPRLPGGGISKTPVECAAPVRIRDKMLVTARVRSEYELWRPRRFFRR